MSKRSSDNANNIIKRPKTGIMIIKIAFGAMFIAIGIAPDPEFEAGARAISIIIGLALIAWAIVPYFSYKRRHKEILEEIEREEEEIRSIRAEMKNKPRKCPHCGATTRGVVCEYCGSALDDRIK